MNASLEAMHRLEEAGFEVYQVGGAVRDSLAHLGEPEDVDLATNANLEDMVRVLEAVPVSIRAKVPTAVFKGVEVTSFRSEKGSRAELVFEPATLEEDAFRRDFTVNSLYMDSSGKVLDPTGKGLVHLFFKELHFIS